MWTWDEDVYLIYVRLTLRSPEMPDQPPTHRAVASELGKKFSTLYTREEVRRRISSLVASPRHYEARLAAARQMIADGEDPDEAERRQQKVKKAKLSEREFNAFLTALSRRFEVGREEAQIEPQASGVHRRRRLSEPPRE
jgi:hypothetical protein